MEIKNEKRTCFSLLCILVIFFHILILMFAQFLNLAQFVYIYCDSGVNIVIRLHFFVMPVIGLLYVFAAVEVVQIVDKESDNPDPDNQG